MPPKSIDDFLISLKQVLSKDAAELIRSQAQAFDKSVGMQGLADKFIGLRPAREAMFDIINGVEHCLYVVTTYQAILDDSLVWRWDHDPASLAPSDILCLV